MPRYAKGLSRLVVVSEKKIPTCYSSYSTARRMLEETRQPVERHATDAVTQSRHAATSTTTPTRTERLHCVRPCPHTVTSAIPVAPPVTVTVTVASAWRVQSRDLLLLRA